MNRNVLGIISIAIAAMVSLLCVLLFNTRIAELTIDYFSFFAGLLLVADGFFEIGRHREEPYLPNHLMRQLRITIGICIFTIHLLQYIQRL